MNTLAIAPQLTLNLLQNMNIKRDTLEKRAIAKEEFQDTTGAGDDNPSASFRHKDNTAVALATAGVAIPEYTPSVDEQYLPKSLRGTNPYSIMNAMTDNVPSASAMIEVGNLETTLATAATSAATDPPKNDGVNATGPEPTATATATATAL